MAAKKPHNKIELYENNVILFDVFHADHMIEIWRDIRRQKLQSHNNELQKICTEIWCGIEQYEHS